MQTKRKSEAAYVLAMDMHGFSKLTEAEHDKIVQNIYEEIARILPDKRGGLLDKKTIGDGFMFYFSSASATVEVAFKFRSMFRGDYVWRREGIPKKLSCRIALHFGQFFWFYDAIENRGALFGRNIITAARLEPVVRQNEVWCTAAFREASRIVQFANQIEFCDLGECELAKGWGQQRVYALYEKGKGKRPVPLSRDTPETIIYDNERLHEFKHTYFALIRLKDRSDGVVHLMRRLVKPDFHFEAAYYLFGNFDVLARFKTEQPVNEDRFSKLLSDEKISHRRDKCNLLEIHFESLDGKEPIVVFSNDNQRYLKAFTYIRSDLVVTNPRLVDKILAFARKACGKDRVVTHYHNRNHLILPIAIPVEKYYALAEAIEAIESFVDVEQLDARITTYPVHGFEEIFTLERSQ